MTDLAVAPLLPPRQRFGGFARAVSGVAAIGVKELRGRMRGRRAFVILTIYLLLLGGFSLMIERVIENNFSSGFGGVSAFAGAAIGQAIFAALLILMTLQVVFLAASSTAGSISLEREKQTLDLLVTTPITSLAIVVGKLLSALVYVFLLIAASIPLMAVVFVFGGIGPEDVVRAYIVLVVTALGLGSFGLLCSSLVKRTTAATAITIFGVLAITIGTVFVLGFWQAVASFDDNGNRRPGPLGIRTPTPLAWVNPFLAQVDVLCGTESTFGGGWCQILSSIVPEQAGGVVFLDNGGAVPVPMPAPMEPGVIIDGKINVDGERVPVPALDARPRDVVVEPAQPFGFQRDSLWTKSVATWLVLSVIFLALSVQAVSPTRRWRLGGGRRSPRSPEA